jgi:hypothetical protein
MWGRRLAAGGVGAGGADDQEIVKLVHDILLAASVPLAWKNIQSGRSASIAGYDDHGKQGVTV